MMTERQVRRLEGLSILRVLSGRWSGIAIYNSENARKSLKGAPVSQLGSKSHIDLPVTAGTSRICDVNLWKIPYSRGVYKSGSFHYSGLYGLSAFEFVLGKPFQPHSVMLFRVIAASLGLAAFASGTILQNGQVRITDFPDTKIDPSAYTFQTYAANSTKLSYKGRWDSNKISYWSYVFL